MEPGHPPRQDPPTEHSHDQVNGSPPKPRSRRGWMSDSPLDGGSGWPTSAYAIVPRQPAPPREESLPAAAEPEEAAPVEPEGRPNRGRLVTLVVLGVVVLAIAVAGGVLATRDASSPRSGTPAAVTTPTPDDPTVAATGPSAGASPSGSAGRSLDVNGSPLPTPSGSFAEPGPVVVESPVPPDATDVLRVGTVRLSALLGLPGETFDFDSGTATVTGADVTAAAVGLNAGTGAMLAVWTAPEPPTLAGCSGTTVQWSNQVLLAAMVPGARVCVQTTDGRYGWFTPRGGGVIVNGALYTTNLDFTVYKKTGD
ncbi:hypothetical protein ACFFX1_04635 [Dactylosporangium sucinum]|uniref:Uncharacterized protein n=1 Tax=Dactylosporangium sucinum TaxID=1424081 RepID=A0A917X3B9_9ACTN|nr:hypothetical protein [Dactylosporangium sucinum]GGM60001.1 hypothetical protein GCM10007977_071930 [Dactylosporangium sucinum]